jgi:hypothetical protein
MNSNVVLTQQTPSSLAIQVLEDMWYYCIAFSVCNEAMITEGKTERFSYRFCLFKEHSLKVVLLAFNLNETGTVITETINKHLLMAFKN